MTFTITATKREITRGETYEKRRERVQNCGKVGYTYDAKTGKPHKVTYQCGLYRLCDHCAEERRKGVRDDVMELAMQAGLYFTFILQDDHRNFTRKLDDYRAYPMQDGREVVFHRNPERGELLRESEQLDWERIAITPEGKRQSSGGQLDLSEDDEPNRKGEVSVHNAKVLSTANEKVEKEIAEEAVRQTSDLKPETKPELELALDRRVSTYATLLREAGYKVTIYRYQSSLDLSELDWQ